MVTTPGNHFPIGSLDCKPLGLSHHGNVTPGAGGFKVARRASDPTLTVAGHTPWRARAELHDLSRTSPYVG